MNASAMDSRRVLVLAVAQDGMSLSEACRQANVTRKTGLKWVKRARSCELGDLAELSRAPKNVVNRTPANVEEALLKLKDEYPEWAGRKLSPLLRTKSGIVLPSRTADRILKRHGLTKPGHPRLAEPIRFERDTCGALLQVDFKGLPDSVPYALLTVIDDHSRFCLSFAPVRDKLRCTVQEALWESFGQHGVPESMLMDNGDCFGSTSAKCPTRFEAWLMRLGIKPIHGRPSHPQTQGKVERFHETAKLELGARLFQDSAELAKPHCHWFVNRYNWVRPHDAHAGKTPGTQYQPFKNKRPQTMPEHVIEQGAISRKVGINGYITFKGKEYKVGRGLIKEIIVIKEAELGLRLSYAGFPLPYLHEL